MRLVIDVVTKDRQIAAAALLSIATKLITRPDLNGCGDKISPELDTYYFFQTSNKDLWTPTKRIMLLTIVNPNVGVTPNTKQFLIPDLSDYVTDKLLDINLRGVKATSDGMKYYGNLNENGIASFEWFLEKTGYLWDAVDYKLEKAFGACRTNDQALTPNVLDTVTENVTTILEM